MAQRPFQIRRCGLAGIEAIAAATAHHFPRHSHDQFGIGLIEAGAQKSLSCRGQVEAGAGDIITVNAGEVHDGMPIGDQGRAWRMLYLAPEVVNAASRELSEDKETGYEFAAPVIHQPQLARQFTALYASLTSPSQATETLHQDQALLDLLAAARHQRRPAKPPAPAPVAIRRAKALIDDDPLAPLSLSDLAHASGLGRFQLLRGFARATGLTPHAYLLQRRIELARRLIGGGQTLAIAAAGSGFADQSHMTRIFTRTYGVSPGAYAALLH